MAVKKIIRNALEDAFESGKQIAKSSGQQLKETFNPWDMIANSFSDGKPNEQNQLKDLKEKMGKGKNATPLNLDKLKETHDRQDLTAMRQKLFQMVKGQDEKLMLEKKQKKAEDERTVAYQEMEKQRQAQAKQQAQPTAPQGKLHQSILGKRKKRGVELPPMEAKPNMGKQ